MSDGGKNRLTRHARKAKKQFLRGYRALLLEVNSIALNILVWGPAPASDTPEAKKRQALAHALIKEGHNAMFSEELPSSGLATHHEEYLQAKSADAIVVLYVSFGAVGEVHDFASVPEISRKMLIWAPRIARSGYGGQGLLKGLAEVGPAQVRFFSDKDLRDCTLVKDTVKHMHQRRWDKWREEH